MEYKLIPTSREVAAVLRARHTDDLAVFESFSNPEGGFMGPTGTGEMMTAWGFPGAACPLLKISTTWDISPERTYERLNEKHQYWLCVAIED